MSDVDTFIKGLHVSSTVLSRGTAYVMDKTTEAVEVKNLYGQILIWGMFSVERGKFKGKLANNAGTEDVRYERS